MTVPAIPAGYPDVCPYLILEEARRFADFFTTVFGAQVQEYLTRPDGLIGHAEIRLGNSVIMLSDATQTHKPNPTMLHVYVHDVDTAYERALAAGASEISKPSDQFYGDRSGGVREACGNAIWIATHVEDVPPAELERRAAEKMT